jgi:lipopolysaccharide export system protein LptA
MKNYVLLFLLSQSLLCHTSIAFCSDSVCENTTIIEADKVKEHDGFIYYNGNVVVINGSVTIKGSNLLSKKIKNSDSVESLYMKQVTFSILKKENIVHGHTDKIIFHISRCIFDLFGNTIINTNGLIQEYNTSIRYILDSNEITPLLLHIDQSIRIH